MAWDNKYRTLEEGEIIQPTDQVEVEKPFGWKAPHPDTVGKPAPSPNYTSHRRYRRLNCSSPEHMENPDV